MSCLNDQWLCQLFSFVTSVFLRSCLAGPVQHVLSKSDRLLFLLLNLFLCLSSSRNALLCVYLIMLRILYFWARSLNVTCGGFNISITFQQSSSQMKSGFPSPSVDRAWQHLHSGSCAIRSRVCVVRLNTHHGFPCSQWDWHSGGSQELSGDHPPAHAEVTVVGKWPRGSILSLSPYQLQTTALLTVGHLGSSTSPLSFTQTPKPHELWNKRHHFKPMPVRNNLLFNKMTKTVSFPEGLIFTLRLDYS